MRNLAGMLGEWKFTRTLMATLSVQSKAFKYLRSDSGKWVLGRSEEPDVEQKIKGLSWETNGGSKTLVYNMTVPKIGKNVDLCLLRCASEDLSKSPKKDSPIHNPGRYLALGEIKGGIDPAGADEHWKTANSALGRISAGFGKSAPLTFFVGAAVASEMAKEIFNQLKTGQLSNAANLTDDSQLVALCTWLIAIQA